MTQNYIIKVADMYIDVSQPVSNKDYELSLIVNDATKMRSYNQATSIAAVASSQEESVIEKNTLVREEFPKIYKLKKGIKLKELAQFGFERDFGMVNLQGREIYTRYFKDESCLCVDPTTREVYKVVANEINNIEVPVLEKLIKAGFIE